LGAFINVTVNTAVLLQLVVNASVMRLRHQLRRTLVSVLASADAGSTAQLRVQHAGVSMICAGQRQTDGQTDTCLAWRSAQL